MFKKLKDKKFRELLIMEMCFLVGTFIIISANFMLNLYLGLYTLAVVLIAYSIFLFKFGRR